MVKISIYRDKNNNWLGFEATGHARQNFDGEYDLICSAISMHLQTIEYSLDKKIKNITKTKKDGYLKIIFPEQDKNLISGIEEVFENGVEILAENYKNIIKVHNKEVEYHV